MFVTRHLFTRAQFNTTAINKWVSNNRSYLLAPSFTNRPAQSNCMKQFSSEDKSNDKLAQETVPIKSESVQKLKKAVKEYGATVIVFHTCISLLSLGTCYLLISTGLDVEQLLIKLKLEEWVKGNTVLVSNAGTFAVAYAVHKLFTPARIAITLGSVPLIVRYLRSKGILKK